MPYAARQQLLDEPNAVHGLQRYWRSAFTEQITDPLIDSLVDAAAGFSSVLSALIFFYMHGAATRVAADGHGVCAAPSPMGFRRRRSVEGHARVAGAHRLGAFVVEPARAPPPGNRVREPPRSR
jgi:hypothetical protein